MKPTYIPSLMRAALTVPAAALMLGAAEAGSTVGLNFQTWYYDSAPNPQTAGFMGAGNYSAYNATGFPVTAKAFGITPADWFNTDPLHGNPHGAANPINQACTFAGGATFAGSLSCFVDSPAGGFQSGSGCQFKSGLDPWPAYAPGVYCPPGEDEALWGIIVGSAANRFSVSVSGLAAKFPNGYVIQALSAHGGGGAAVTSLPGVDFTDDTTTNTAAYHTWVIQNGPGAQWPTTTAGLSDPSSKFTANTIKIKSKDDATGILASLAGVIITDQPVVSLPPKNTSVPSGNTLTLTAGAVGLPPITYQWRKNGTPIPGETAATLTKTGATTGDSGSYDVVATNTYGIATSDAADVTVAVPVPVTWDGDTGTTGAQDGDGTWDSTASNWWNGSSDIAWNTFNPATIGAGGAGNYTINLAANISVSSLVFNANYTITNAAQNITLAGPSGTTGFTVNSNATFNVPLLGTGGLTKAGNGTLTLGRVGSYTGGTTVNGGVLALASGNGAAGALSSSSSLTINNGGTVQVNTDNSLAGYGSAVGTLPVTINAGATLTGLSTANSGAGTSSHIWGVLTLNGGTLTAGGTQNQPGYGTWDLHAGVVVNGGATTSTINCLNVIPCQTGGTIFNVAAGGTSSGVDLLVSGTLIKGSGLADTGIIKEGAGTMTLSGNNTFSGGTIVNAGTLILAGNNSGSATVNAGSLEVSGRLNAGLNKVFLGDGTTLRVSANPSDPAISTTGEIAVGDINNSEPGSTTVTFSKISSTTVAAVSAGDLFIDKPTTINIASVTPVIGRYPLLKGTFSAEVASDAEVITGSMPSGITATIVDDTAGSTQSIYLDVTAITIPTLAWTGAVSSGIWDINTTANWTPANYSEGSSVTFDDAATGTTNVVLNSTVHPALVTFANESVDYTLGGTGAIAGATSLTKTGTGTLTIANTNTFTGGTSILGGILTLQRTSIGNVLNNAVLQIDTSAGPLSFNSSVTGTGTFTKTGANTLTITGGMQLTKTLTAAEGTLEVQAKSPDAPYEILSGATLKLGYTTAGGYATTNLKIRGDGAAATTGLYLAGGTIYNVSGSMELLDAPTTIRQYGTGVASIGIFDINNQGLICNDAASGSATDANVKFVSLGYGMSVNIAAGSETATGDFTLNGPLDVNANGFGLYKRGAGSLRLNQAATANNKGVRIEAGTVICGVAECLGTNSAVTINPAGVLALNGFNQTVPSLYFGTVQQAAGTWGAEGSGAAHIDNIRFSGTGVLTVGTGPVSGGFTSWIANPAFGLSAADQAATADPDHDGVANLMEYVLNGVPNQSDSSILPELTTTATNFVFTFERLVESATGTTQVFEYSGDLSQWTKLNITVPTATQVVLGTPANGVQTVTVTIPRTSETGGKLFGRLTATAP